MPSPTCSRPTISHLSYRSNRRELLLAVDLSTKGVSMRRLLPWAIGFLALAYPLAGSAARLVGCASDSHSISCRQFPGTATLNPLGLSVVLEQGGRFAFEPVSAGEYEITISPRCVPSGCFAPSRVTVTDHNGTLIVPAMILVPHCPGQCRQTGSVDVGDVVQCITRSLGGAGCRGCDRNADAEVSIDEIVAVVQSVLEGCD